MTSLGEERTSCREREKTACHACVPTPKPSIKLIRRPRDRLSTPTQTGLASYTKYYSPQLLFLSYFGTFRGFHPNRRPHEPNTPCSVEADMGRT